MKCFRFLIVTLLVAAVGGLSALAQEEPISKDEFKAQLQEWLPGMGAEKIPDRRDSQQKLQEVCFQVGAPGREADRAVVCTVIAEALGGEMAPPARVWLLKQLERTGREECVAAVAKCLKDGDEHVRDAARRALANIPAKQANAALLAELSGAGGSWRVGLINALGYRADADSVAALAKLVGDRDAATVEAAANALGKIAGPEAARALKTAWQKCPDAAKLAVGDAYLKCADQLLKAGKRTEAIAIYNELATEQSPKAIRLAAIQGKLKAAGKTDK